MNALARRGGALERNDGAVAPAEFASALRQIERINCLTFAYRPTLRWLARAARRAPVRRPLRILDAGCGAGDMLRRIALWAERRNVPVHLTGVDRHPAAVALARSAGGRLPIAYRTADIFDLPASEPVDVVVSAAMRILPVGPLVRHDAPLSVARAFVRRDWTDLVARGGLDPAKVEIARAFPFRWAVGFLR